MTASTSFPGSLGIAASAWEAKYRTGNGLLIYHPSSDAPLSPRKLTTQLVCDLLAAMIAAWVVASTQAAYWKRVSIVGALATFGCLGVSALYWNWYGFTHAFFAAHCFDKMVGWLLAGLVIAKLAPQPAHA
jgi:hypothetical protein